MLLLLLLLVLTTRRRERLQEGGEHRGGRHLACVEVGLDEGVLRHEEKEERSGSGGWADWPHGTQQARPARTARRVQVFCRRAVSGARAAARPTHGRRPQRPARLPLARSDA